MRACTYAKFPTNIFAVVAMQSVAMLPSVSLKDRVFRSGSSCSLPVGTASRQGRTYRSWTQQQMETEVTAVLNEGSSIRRAALECGIPKSSLGDRISGRVLVDATCGPSTYLSPREEAELHLLAEGELRTRICQVCSVMYPICMNLLYVFCFRSHCSHTQV